MKRWKDFLLNFLFYASFYLVATWLLGWQKSTPRLIFESIFQGILFAVVSITLVPIFLKHLSRKLEATVPLIDLQKDEQVIFKEPSGHFKGRITIGGVLFLTNRRLVFKSHKLNFAKADAEIPMNAIASATLEPHKSRKILRLQVADNNVHRFVVDGAVEWVRRLSA